jgi:hypothetical protein
MLEVELVVASPLEKRRRSNKDDAHVHVSIS